MWRLLAWGSRPVWHAWYLTSPRPSLLVKTPSGFAAQTPPAYIRFGSAVPGGGMPPRGMTFFSPLGLGGARLPSPRVSKMRLPSGRSRALTSGRQRLPPAPGAASRQFPGRPRKCCRPKRLSFAVCGSCTPTGGTSVQEEKPPRLSDDSTVCARCLDCSLKLGESTLPVSFQSHSPWPRDAMGGRNDGETDISSRVTGDSRCENTALA